MVGPVDVLLASGYRGGCDAIVEVDMEYIFARRESVGLPTLLLSVEELRMARTTQIVVTVYVKTIPTVHSIFRRTTRRYIAAADSVLEPRDVSKGFKNIASSSIN